MKTLKKFFSTTFDEDMARICIAINSLVEDKYSELDACPTEVIVEAVTTLFGSVYVPHFGFAYMLVATNTNSGGVEFAPTAIRHSWIVHLSTGIIVDLRHPCSRNCALTVFDTIKPVYVDAHLSKGFSIAQMHWMKRMITRRLPHSKKE